MVPEGEAPHPHPTLESFRVWQAGRGAVRSASRLTLSQPSPSEGEGLMAQYLGQTSRLLRGHRETVRWVSALDALRAARWL